MWFEVTRKMIRCKGDLVTFACVMVVWLTSGLRLADGQDQPDKEHIATIVQGILNAAARERGWEPDPTRKKPRITQIANGYKIERSQLEGRMQHTDLGCALAIRVFGTHEEALAELKHPSPFLYNRSQTSVDDDRLKIEPTKFHGQVARWIMNKHSWLDGKDGIVPTFQFDWIQGRLVCSATSIYRILAYSSKSREWTTERAEVLYSCAKVFQELAEKEKKKSQSNQPVTITLISPPDQSKMVVVEPSFYWRVETEPGRDLRYQLWIGGTPDQFNAEFAQRVTGTYHSVREPLPHDVTYYWKVTAFDLKQNRQVGESEVWSLRTKSDPWRELVLAHPLRPSPDPNRPLLRITAHKVDALRIHFRQIEAVPAWQAVQVVGRDGTPIAEWSSNLSGVIGPPVRGDRVDVYALSLLKNSRPNYVIDKILYQNHEDISQWDVISENVRIRWAERHATGNPCVGPSDRVTAQRPDDGAEVKYGNILFGWHVDLRDEQVASQRLYVGPSADRLYLYGEPMFWRYEMPAREVERLLLESTERELYWTVQVQFARKANGPYKFCTGMRALQVKPPIMPALRNLRPPFDANDVPTTMTFHWDVRGAIGQDFRYKAFLARSDEIAKALSEDSVAETFFRMPVPLEPATSYRWGVNVYSPYQAEPIVEGPSIRFATRGTPTMAKGSELSNMHTLISGRGIQMPINAKYVRYFKFELTPTAPRGRITLKSIGGVLKAKLFSSGSTTVPVKTVDLSSDAQQILDLSAEESGEGLYFVAVSGSQGGEFSIRLDLAVIATKQKKGVMAPEATTPQPATAQLGSSGFSSAVPIAAGQNMGGTVEKGSKRYYKFGMSPGQVATLRMQPLDSDLDLFGYGPGPTENTIANSGNGNTQLETFTITATAAGTYYAVIDGFTTSRYTIFLKAPGTATPPPTVPTVMTTKQPSVVTGASFVDAISITSGQTLNGNVEKESKRYYRFDLTAGQTVTVTMQPTESDLDLFGYGPGPTADTIANSGKPNAEAEKFSITAAASGTHYAVVDGFSASSYSITLKTAVVTPPPTATMATGASFAQAISVALGQAFNGKVEKGSKRYYKFDLTAGQTARIRMQPIDADLDLFGYGPGPTANTIANSGKGETETESISITASETGTHYAVVDGFSTSKFTITFASGGGN